MRNKTEKDLRNRFTFLKANYSYNGKIAFMARLYDEVYEIIYL